jgi:hypothetical protein
MSSNAKYIKMLEEQNEELKARLAFREKDQNMMLDQFLKNWKNYHSSYRETVKYIGWDKDNNFTYDPYKPKHIEKVKELLLAIYALNENMEGMLYRYGE